MGLMQGEEGESKSKPADNPFTNILSTGTVLIVKINRPKSALPNRSPPSQVPGGQEGGPVQDFITFNLGFCMEVSRWIAFPRAFGGNTCIQENQKNQNTNSALVTQARKHVHAAFDFQVFSENPQHMSSGIHTAERGRARRYSQSALERAQCKTSLKHQELLQNHVLVFLPQPCLWMLSTSEKPSKLGCHMLSPELPESLSM